MASTLKVDNIEEKTLGNTIQLGHAVTSSDTV